MYNGAVVLIFNTGSDCVAQAGLKLMILRPQPPRWLGLQAHVTVPTYSYYYFHHTDEKNYDKKLS